ncbi:XdhC family protein [Psychrobacter cryohalolentis]|uniref:Molybdenum cofactor sulfurylase n=1 Tax=Psychrobacter cryohalolentis (strain ATCC BAA-1226 / DSM 17306 / VKM B-2378 / K5) TaxID=335284 RepID=Q1QBN0_PSYCK|nr:XdhC family protein [Psychrobacter cryohalolentis]ABE74923.1 molybdenum cofactor sulfurylase [Psychrobacter cryohalolentis K5]
MNKSLITPMPPTKWYNGLAQYQQQGIAHVLATVVAVNGSAPRDLQSKMIVTLDACCDTLGGGSLEHDVTITARQLLNGELDTTEARSTQPLKEGKSEKAQAVRRDAVYTKHYPLGATLAQCCGGSVTVMFECFNVTPPMSLLVFGAGHVAAALMTILTELPCQVDWVDSRAEMFERYLTHNPDTVEGRVTYQLPTHIRPHIDEDPVDFVQPFVAKSIESALMNASTKKGTQYFILVMTHDHSLDFDLVRAALDAYVKIGIDSSSLPYLGCISSATKAKRFRDRLLQRDYNEQIVDKLTMPIGLNTGGKEPMAVAISIAAQVMQLYNDL